MYASQIRNMMDSWPESKIEDKVEILRKLKNLARFLQNPSPEIKTKSLENSAILLAEAEEQIRHSLTCDLYLSTKFQLNWKFGVLLSSHDQRAEALKYITKAEELADKENIGKVWHKKMLVMLLLYKKTNDPEILSQIGTTAQTMLNKSTDIPTRNIAKSIADAATHHDNYQLYGIRHNLGQFEFRA